MTFRAYMIKIQFESRPGLKSEYNDSLLFMVLYREALDRLCVRLNMYLVCLIIAKCPFSEWCDSVTLIFGLLIIVIIVCASSRAVYLLWIIFQRNLTETQKDAIIKDFNSLNLTMYIGEMVRFSCLFSRTILCGMLVWFSVLTVCNIKPASYLMLHVLEMWLSLFGWF